MRVIASGKGAVNEVLDLVLQALSGLLMASAKNPGKPRFNHFMFEAIGGAVRFSCATDSTKIDVFESALFPVFQEVLQSDVIGRLIIIWWLNMCTGGVFFFLRHILSPWSGALQ